MKSSGFCAVPLFLILFGFVSVHASTKIDLNDFFFFPGDPVIIAADGSSATIGELSGTSPIILSNDPILGDPNAISSPLPPLQVLMFDFIFDEPTPDNDDEFGAFVIDPATGNSLGAGFEFFTQSPGSGSLSFDLTSQAGTPNLGLQFQLSSLPGDVNSTSEVTVSNVKLKPIPEPTAILLFGSGLLALVGISKKIFFNKSR